MPSPKTPQRVAPGAPFAPVYAPRNGGRPWAMHRPPDLRMVKRFWRDIGCDAPGPALRFETREDAQAVCDVLNALLAEQHPVKP